MKAAICSQIQEELCYYGQNADSAASLAPRASPAFFENVSVAVFQRTLPPFSWALSIISRTSSAYAVAGSGWSALYLPLYTSGLGACAEH